VGKLKETPNSPYLGEQGGVHWTWRGGSYVHQRRALKGWEGLNQKEAAPV